MPGANPYEQTYFNDSTTEYNITFSVSHLSEIFYVEIPRRLNITNAELNLTGYNIEVLKISRDGSATGPIGTGASGNSSQNETVSADQINIGAISMKLYRNTFICDYEYRYEVWTDSGGPSAILGYTQWVNMETLPYNTLVWAKLNMTSPLTVTPASTYQFVLAVDPASIGNCWITRYSSNLGGRVWYNDTGGGWGIFSGTFDDRMQAIRIYEFDFLENITIDSGNDGSDDYTNTTAFITSEIIDLNATAIMDHLRYTCTADWDTGNCTVPFNTSSATDGILYLTDMNISGSLFVPYPNITIVHNYTSGLNVSITGIVNITVASEGHDNVTCNITFNNENHPNENYTVPVMTGEYTFTMIDGTNTITVNCTNDMNFSTYASETFTRYIKYYALINEETGDPYVITTENVSISVPSQGISYNFSAGEDDIYFVLNESTDVRFEIEYEGITGIITRDFNTGLAETNETRVCIAESQTFYEQILYSSTRTALELKATLANCLILQDYTKFAYTNALMARTYTVPIMYELRYWDTDGNKTLLGRLDGGIASSTNIDLIELKSREYVISVLTEGVSISALTDETLKFYYSNPNNNNDEIIVTIRNGTDVLYTVTVTDTPNEYTFTWDHNVTDITDMLLTIDVEKFIDGDSVGTITRIFYANGLSGSLNPAVAMLISGVLVFFGLTFVAVRFVFGYFGIITMVMALAILTQAPANQYVILLQAIEVIMLVFIIFLMKGEYAKRQVT